MCKLPEPIIRRTEHNQLSITRCHPISWLAYVTLPTLSLFFVQRRVAKYITCSIRKSNLTEHCMASPGSLHVFATWSERTTPWLKLYPSLMNFLDILQGKCSK